MGNNNEGSQQGKEPGNEPSGASGSSENVGSTTNESSSQVSSGVADTIPECDGSISSGGAENVADQMDGELESTIEADLRTDENPDYLDDDDGYNIPVDVNYRRKDADGKTDDGGDVGIGMISEGGNPERHLTSSKTLSIGDEEEDGERLELERAVGPKDSDSAFQNSETSWRDSIASTMTDASEMYQTAGEDSDNEVGYNKEGYDDDDDDLRKTLRASQLRENITDATSIGYVSLTGEDKLRESWEKEDPNVNPGYLVESDKFTFIKGFPTKPVSSTTDEGDDFETEKLRDATSPHRSGEVSMENDRVGEVLNAYGEDDNHQVIVDEKVGIDDVDGEVGNVVERFDITRYQIDPEKQSAATNDLMDFEQRDYADASEVDNDEIVTLRVSSVSLQLQSPAPSGGSPKDDEKMMGAEEDAATGHTEQYDEELPADIDTRHYSEPDTSETDSDAEETSVVGRYQIADDDDDDDYDPTDDVRGDVDVDVDDADDDILSSPHVNEHGVSSHFSSSVRVVLASNTEGSDFPSERLENPERDEREIEGHDIAKDERVSPKDETADNANLFSSDVSHSLNFEPASLSEQKEIDMVRSQPAPLSGDRGVGSSEEEDVPLSALAYSQEHEQNNYRSTPPADDNSFRGTSPSALEASPESKSDETFVSNAREQEPRTKTTNDEERTAFGSDVDSDVGRRIRVLSAGVKTEEKEEAEKEEVERVSDRRSIGLVSMATIDDDEAETVGGSVVPRVEHQSWSGGEEEPEPDYSLSSDDDASDDVRPSMKDLIELGRSTATRSASSSEEHRDFGDEAPEYRVSVKETETFSLSSTTIVSEQSPDNNNETIDSRSDDFEAWEDDPDHDDVPLGKFQRMSSIRPSKRGRTRSRRSVAVPPSFSEHPEEEGSDFQVDDTTPGAESVFLPHSAETLTIPHSSSYDRGPMSVPASGKELERDLWAKTSRDSTRSMTARNDGGSQSQKRGFLERRNATRTNKPDVPSDEKEWTKYDVVLRKNEDGFGITLSNFSPVIVHRVQEDGVAAKNGIREGDRIHKVNGSLVSNCSHEEVINLIKSSGKDVFLVLQRPSSSETRDQPAPSTPSITDNMRLSRLPSKISTSSTTSTKGFSGISSITGRMSSPPEVHDSSYDVVPKPFTDLTLLKQRPAHLAVFLNYLLAEGKPNAMLFTLIADCYQNSFKESNNSARRWAYEIYSTFLMSSAPLKLTVDDAMGRSVEKMLQGGSTNGLLALFIPIANFMRNEVVYQLKQFVVSWKSGERNNYASDYNLRTMNLDRQLEFQMIEGALWKHFEHCVADERSDAKHAIAYSLATFFRQIGYGGAKNSNLLENCPTFMSKDKKALKNRMKKHFAHKGHQFSPRQFAAVTQCQLCQKVIWGLGHQAYHCSSCDLSIHRHCTEKIIDVCGRSRRSVRDMIPGRKPQNPVKDELQKNFFLPPFMSDPDDLRNLTTPVIRNGSEHERLQFPEFTTEFAGRSPNRSCSRQVCGSDDSDLEVDSDLPQLTDFIPKEELRQMKEKEKKRQQIINELFHTERLHTRSLKVMDKVFFRPMQDESFIDQEFVALLFPNLQDLIQLHDSLKKEFVALRKEKAVVDEVGLLLINRFSGSHGKKLKEACATFCADQSYALNVLRRKQKKDPRYSTFLQEAAANTLCKRQELKDFLPREMQRLSKYPLLIDSLRKNTSTSTEEHALLAQALDLSKSLLEHVNQAVKSVQNQRHLTDMQQRLDWRSGDTSSLGQYKFLNLTKHTLVYDGEVTWRPYRSRPIELHMVLFEDILVLLQKQDDRLVLRGQMTTVEDTKFPYCPVLKLNSLMIKDCATDKCAFFVVDSSTCPQVYDLLTHSKEEKSKWFHYIQDTIKRYLGVHGPYKGGRGRSATQMIDLVSFSKSERGPTTLADDADLPSNQTSDGRSASCHILTTYDDSPDNNSTTTTGNDMQQVVSRLTTEESFGATKLSNVDECDNDVKDENKDDCGNIVDAPWSEAARFELARRLDELILCINQTMREKLKLASEDTNSLFADDNGSIQASEVHALDAKGLVTTALAYVKNLMDLVNDQRGGDVASSPDSSSVAAAEERRIAIPAEDLLNISATLQRLTAQLAMRVTTDVAELERLEEDFRVALDDLKEKSSAIQPVLPPGDRRPDDLVSSSSAIDIGASSENAFFPAASQANIYTVFNEDQLTYYDYHDHNDNANSDIPTEESKSTVVVDED